MHTYLYLYAVGDANTEHALPEGGLLPVLPVRRLERAGLAAFVSPVPASIFDQAALPALLRDAERARELVLAHHRIVGELNGAGSVLPCAFCTVFRDEAGLHAMLDAQAEALHAALVQVTGAQEWGLKISCDRVALAGWVAREDATLADLRAKATSASTGAAYMFQRRLQQAADARVGPVGTALIERIHRELAGLARDARTGELPPPAQDQAATVMHNGAYLVPLHAVEAFQQLVAQFADEHAAQGLLLALTGPWPPYSFATSSVAEVPA